MFKPFLYILRCCSNNPSPWPEIRPQDTPPPEQYLKYSSPVFRKSIFDDSCHRPCEARQALREPLLTPAPPVLPVYQAPVVFSSQGFFPLEYAPAISSVADDTVLFFTRKQNAGTYRRLILHPLSGFSFLSYILSSHIAYMLNVLHKI